MTRGGRMALILTAGLLVLIVVGILMMLNAVERRVEPACLDCVAEAPEADIWPADGDRPGNAEGMLLPYSDGTSVHIPRRRKRIVSALPGITEMVVFVNAGNRLVAVTEHCDYPPEVVEDLPRVSVLPFDPEGILAVAPDLLLVDRRLHRRDLDVIRSRVRGVLMLDTSHSLAHLSESLAMLCQLLGDDVGRNRLAYWNNQKDALLTSIKERHTETPQRVLVVAQWDPLYVLGKGALIDDLLRICGCVNVACDLESDASGTFPEELVLARRPDWILTPRKPMPERLRERWKNIPAVKKGQMTDGSGDELVRAGPRILDGLERLADTLLGKPKADGAK